MPRAVLGEILDDGLVPERRIQAAFDPLEQHHGPVAQDQRGGFRVWAQLRQAT